MPPPLHGPGVPRCRGVSHLLNNEDEGCCLRPCVPGGSGDCLLVLRSLAVVVAAAVSLMGLGCALGFPEFMCIISLRAHEVPVTREGPQ